MQTIHSTHLNYESEDISLMSYNILLPNHAEVVGIQVLPSKYTVGTDDMGIERRKRQQWFR